MAASEVSSKLPCWMVNDLSRNSLQCNFVENNCLEKEAMNYTYFVYCVMGSELRYLATIIIVFLIVAFFLTLSAIADEFLCPSLLTMSKSLKMSDNLAGVTLLALGNGCSDIFTSLAAASDDRSQLIVSELLGAGIFCLSIVAGLVFINKDFRLAYRPLLRDTIFYLIALYYTWYVCWGEEITFYKALVFILIYVIYLIVAITGQAIYSRLQGQYAPSEVEAKSKVLDNTVLDKDDESWFGKRAGSMKMHPKMPSLMSEDQSILHHNKISPSYGVIGNPMNCLDLQPPPMVHRQSLDSLMPRKLELEANLRFDSNHGWVNRAFNSLNETAPDYSIAKPISKELMASKVCIELAPVNKQSTVKCQNRLETSDCRRRQTIETNWPRSRADNMPINDWDDLLMHINPFDSENWCKYNLAKKVITTIRAPFVFVARCTIPVVDLEKRNNNWCRPLNSFHCVIIPLVTVFSNKVIYNIGEGLFGACYPIIVLIPGLVLAIFLLKTTENQNPPSYHVVFAYAGFLMSILWVYLLVTEILGLLHAIGVIFSMSDVTIGLAFLAWGNSLGDIVANLTLASAGYPRMALGASIGAPLLNLLIGFGLSFTIGLSPGETMTIEYTPTISLLCISLAIIILALMLCTLVPPSYSRKPFGYMLIGGYAVYFISAICLEYKFVTF